MATDLDFVQYLCDQMRAAGPVTYRKMFGEYALYLDTKVVALVCDNQLFVKPTVAGRALIGTPDEAPAYPGGKPQFRITDQLEDQEWLARLIAVTAAELPLPKPKSLTRTARASPRGSARPRSRAGRCRRPCGGRRRALR